MYVVIHMSHTSHRAATLEGWHGPAKGLALQAQRALEERDEVFIVLFGLFVVMMRKGKHVGAHSAWWQHTKLLLPGQT